LMREQIGMILSLAAHFWTRKAQKVCFKYYVGRWVQRNTKNAVCQAFEPAQACKSG
jgi:hypothetical protein